MNIDHPVPPEGVEPIEPAGAFGYAFDLLAILRQLMDDRPAVLAKALGDFAGALDPVRIDQTMATLAMTVTGLVAAEGADL